MSMDDFGPMNRAAWWAGMKKSWWKFRCNIYFIFYDVKRSHLCNCDCKTQEALVGSKTLDLREKYYDNRRWMGFRTVFFISSV